MRQSRDRGSKVETEARPCEAEARPSQLKKLPRGRLEPRQMPRTTSLVPCGENCRGGAKYRFGQKPVDAEA